MALRKRVSASPSWPVANAISPNPVRWSRSDPANIGHSQGCCRYSELICCTRATVRREPSMSPARSRIATMRTSVAKRRRRHRHHDRGPHLLPDRNSGLVVAGISLRRNQRLHDADRALRFGRNLALEPRLRFFGRLRHEVEIGLAGHRPAPPGRRPHRPHPHGATRALRAGQSASGRHKGRHRGPHPPAPPARAARLALT